MRPSLVAWLCLVAALVLAAASVRVHADDAMMASAVEASVAAAIAADAGADAEHAVDAAALAEVDAAADAEVEAARKKKKKAVKAKAKAKAKAKKRRYVGGDIMFNRAMSVRGVMAAGSLIANNATVQGTLIARQLKAKRVRAHTMSVGELKTTRLSSPTGTIVIEGDLLITHSRTLEFPKKKANATKLAKKGGKKAGKNAAAKAAGKAAKGMSFLAEEVVVGGVKQWALVRHDHFEHHNADGWHLVGSNEAVATSACTSGGDHFLGGHCELANGPARKAYTHLPPHTQVRVTARYHFIDNWRGETAFAAIGDDYVWTQTHHLSTGAGGRAAGLQLCGSDAYPETRLSAPIDVSVPHTDSTLTLSFGARSAHSSASGSSAAEERAVACERSFGVDDVAVYIR